MERGSKMRCPKCGSSEYSMRYGASITTANLRTKMPQNKIECDNCGFDWKWE